MVPRSGKTMIALVDSIQQRHQMQPQTLNYFNTGILLQTPTTEEMDVACSMGQVQPEIISSLEMTIVDDHLPAGYEQSSTSQTQTLRDFEKHLNDLKKENFSLKLRIYFLEERIQQKYEASKEDVYKRNIELKVEVESLKRELQEKQESLDKAWVAVENLHSQNEGDICQQQKNEHTCDILENKIHLLQEEAQSAKTKAEKMTTLAEIEKKRCLELNSQLMEFSKKQDETQKSQALLETYQVTLAEKEKRIEELTWNLKEKEQLLELLSTEKQDQLQCLEEPWKMKVQNLCDDQQKLAQSDLPLDKQASELNNSEVLEISSSSATNKQLQEKLDEMTFELRSVQYASQRQDHRIQNLNEILKNKENECEELNRIIGEQSETITKLQDMLHRSQLGQLQISEDSPTFQQQQTGLLNVQNTLFFTQLEVQRLKRTQQQKDCQLTVAKKTTQLLETMLQEEQQQKEAAWKHNKELRATLQQLKTELQDKNWRYCTWKRETLLEMERQEQKIKHLNDNLAFKEQLLQESKELLLHLQKQDKNPTSADKMVQRLQQRIKDRDAALERAVDEKFSVLEDRERELQQLRLSVKEREHDLEGLHQVLSSNQATIQDLESLLKSKDLEREHLLASYQNLQWLKEEMEAKLCRWQSEQEGVIQQLRTILHDRNKEVEELSATLLYKLVPEQRDTVEELYLRLHNKEKIIEQLLCDKSLQTVEQVTELQQLLQAVSIREQQSHISSKKMTQALTERGYELQTLRQQLKSQICPPKTNVSTAQRIQKDVPVEELKQGDSGTNTAICERENGGSKMEKGVQETTAGLEEELINAKEELELLTRKERESRLELSALQSVIASQEEELQVQASDVESLTRSIKIKEELIKDLQMQLVDPEEMPAIERLTQEVLMLQEKVASVELQGQEDLGSKRLQLLLALEGLAAERNQLNETLKAEKQLYSSLVKFHAHPASSGPEQTLQRELEEVQALRRQLEEALGRSLERLSRLESLHDIGGSLSENASPLIFIPKETSSPYTVLTGENSLSPGLPPLQLSHDLTLSEDAEDAGTEFTDSIEEEAAQRITQHQSIKGDADDNLVGYSTCPSPHSLVNEKGLQEELLSAKSEIQQVLEQKKKLEGELQDLKGQIEEAGFSSVSQLRKALLSLCLENAELKEQVGEAMLSEGWENEDSKEDEENLRLEVRKLQEKLHTSEIVIGLLKEQLTLNSQGGSTSTSFNHQFTSSVAQDIAQLQMAKQCNCLGLLNSNAPQLHCPPSKVVDSSPSPLKGAQVEGGRLTGSFGQQFMDPRQRRHSELPQCRQQCHKLQDKLLVSEASIQTQMAQLEEYQALLSEPVVQQYSKQVQVDLQDLGYETCGRSENEADREETTSPECEDHVEELKTWNKLLGSPTSKLEKHDLSQCEDVAILRQHIQALQVQLQSSYKVIRNLQSRVHSISTTSDYASGGEHPLKMKQGYTLGSSSSHSITDEDEGWQSDSFGSFCPPGLQVNKDLAMLIQRVSHLEALLGDTKPKLQLPEELKPPASLGKYDSLVQAQARELSHLRQMMREGQGLCRMLIQHFRNIIKSFEDLLRGTDIDYFLGQSFREQLAQGNQLAGRLARKLGSRNDLNTEDKSSHELFALRLSKELEEKEQVIKTLQAKLQVHSVTPSSNHTMSESFRSGSSTSFLSDGLEGCSDMDDATEYSSYQEDSSGGQFHSFSSDKDLGGHLGKTSAQSSHPALGSTSPAAPTESLQRNFAVPPSQDALMTVNQASRGFHPDSLSKPTSFPWFPFDSEPCCSFMSLGPPPPPAPAPAPLLGCCRTPVFSLAEAQQELQMLQKQLGESVKVPAPSPVKPGSLAGFFSTGSPAVHSKDCLQACHPVPMQNSPGWNKISGGQTGESSPPWYIPPFRQTQGRPVSGPLPSCSSTFFNQKLSGADLLEEHLSEIRMLRQRLEESICTNDHLREQLEARLASVVKTNELERLQAALLASHSKVHDGKAALEQQRIDQQRLQEEIRGKQQDFMQLQKEFLASQMNNSRLQDRVTMLQQQCEENRVFLQALQAELHVYEALCRVPQQKATTESHGQEDLVPTDGVNKQGGHVIGHLKDYCTLQKQILEGKNLIHRMASLLQPALEPRNSKVFYMEVIKQLLTNASCLHQILEKSATTLSTFWRGPLHGPQISSQDQSMKNEIQILRTKLAEQESHLQSNRDVKESMENFLLTHLTRTYDVLRKARTNLEGISQQPTPISVIM